MADWIAIIGLTAANTFWLFYLSGDIPGTVEHRHRTKKMLDRRQDRLYRPQDDQPNNTGE